MLSISSSFFCQLSEWAFGKVEVSASMIAAIASRVKLHRQHLRQRVGSNINVVVGDKTYQRDPSPVPPVLPLKCNPHVASDRHVAWRPLGLVSRGRCGHEIAQLRRLADRGRCELPAILRLTPKITSG